MIAKLRGFVRLRQSLACLRTVSGLENGAMLSADFFIATSLSERRYKYSQNNTRFEVYGSARSSNGPLLTLYVVGFEKQ